MKIYWSDREGNSAPPHATFYWRPFSSPCQITPTQHLLDLPNPVSVKVLKRTFLPTKEKWIEGVHKALDLISRKELQKVVLARICTLELATEPDPFALTAVLKKGAEGSFTYCLQSKTNAFLGATPERLYLRTNRHIISEAIAGTRPRGKTPFEEATLQRQLLTSTKDLREFAPVQAYLQSALSPLCISPLTFSPLSIHQTQNVQHLYSRCSGNLKETISDEQILTHLHPTPALCGTPKQKALSIIQQLEPFERGLYGGAIGWTTPEASEWIVAIRSCLLQGKTATLFSGTGIVEGSNPEEEWEELNQKIKLYDPIFN